MATVTTGKCRPVAGEKMASAVAETAAEARKWLESHRVTGNHSVSRGPFDFILMSPLSVSLIEAGHALCTYRVPAHAADADSNWESGAIATVIDDVGIAAIMTTEGIVKVSVDFDISFFSPAKINEELEIDARVMAHKGKRLSMVVVEIKKKESGEMVAMGRQWMSSPRRIPSKL